MLHYHHDGPPDKRCKYREPKIVPFSFHWEEAHSEAQGSCSLSSYQGSIQQRFRAKRGGHSVAI